LNQGHLLSRRVAVDVANAGLDPWKQAAIVGRERSDIETRRAGRGADDIFCRARVLLMSRLSTQFSACKIP